MNKKQWYALGILFMGFALVFSHPVVNYMSLTTITGLAIAEDAPYIVLNIRHQTYVLLMWLSVMTSVACWICGLLEKEEAR